MLRKILEPNPSIDPAQLALFAMRNNLDLPKSYQEFLLTNNGGQPVPAGFPIEGLKKNPTGIIQAFFGLNASISTEDLETNFREVAEIIEGIFPIACTGTDDFLCIDLRKARSPVVFWDRKPFWGDNIWREGDLYHVTDNFDQLLVALK